MVSSVIPLRYGQMKMVGEKQRGFVSPFAPVDFSFLAIVVSTQSNVMQSLFGHWSLNVFITESPHVRQSGFWNPGNFLLWNPEFKHGFSCGLRIRGLLSSESR